MTRRTIALALLALAVTGGLVFLKTRPVPKAPPPASVVEPPAPRTPARDGSRAVTPPPAGASASRRPRTAPPAAAPAPAPAPVEAAPEAGILRIESDVPGAQVFIDRQFVGATPVTASSVKPGTHQLNVSAEGYDGIAQTIDVEPGPRDIKVRFKEVRLDAKIDVVHKHRIGSCTGRLIATSKGLRYETTDKDDGFTAGLLDLETFQVDYMEKNLKVKLRNGKQYNFTDPGGNADHLFVFHRDVEKARERLKKGDAPGE